MPALKFWLFAIPLVAERIRFQKKVLIGYAFKQFTNTFFLSTFLLTDPLHGAQAVMEELSQTLL